MALLNIVGRVDEDSVSTFAVSHQRETKRIIQYLKKNKLIPEVTCPAGPCIPGQHKLFIEVGGNLCPCERVNERQRS